MNYASSNSDNRPSIFTVPLLLLLVIMAGTCLLYGFLFLWQDSAHAWVPLAIGLFILIASFAGWLVAQKDASQEESGSTTVSDNQGNQVVTDTRALESPLAMQNLGTLLSQMSHREPLSGANELEDEQESAASSLLEEASQAERRLTPLGYGWEYPFDNGCV